MSSVVFISHASSDADRARDFCRQLADARIPYWIATEKVAPGESYPLAIAKAIRKCTAFVLLFSGAADESEMVSTELDLASRFQKKIIPVRLEAGQEPHHLALGPGVTWADFDNVSALDLRHLVEEVPPAVIEPAPAVKAPLVQQEISTPELPSPAPQVNTEPPRVRVRTSASRRERKESRGLDETERKLRWALWAVLSIIAMGTILYLLTQTDAYGGDAKRPLFIEPVSAPQSQPAVVSEFSRNTLPSGVSLLYPANGLESQLIDAIQDSKGALPAGGWKEFDRVLFEPGKGSVSSASMEQLRNIAAILNSYPKVRIQVFCTPETIDPTPTDLSTARAHSIVQELTRLGVQPFRMSAQVLEGQPPAPGKAIAHLRVEAR